MKGKVTSGMSGLERMKIILSISVLREDTGIRLCRIPSPRRSPRGLISTQLSYQDVIPTREGIQAEQRESHGDEILRHDQDFRVQISLEGEGIMG